jgi:hypothetical protein
MTDLTVNDALDLIAATAQHCRENGDGDMRNILNQVRGIKRMIGEGKTGDEIMEAYTIDEDDED